MFRRLGTYFAIFSPTASNALQLQAITEEVKACKAISNDLQRLKCFDGLFADKPNPPNAADKSANEGNWSIAESKSPTDGSPQIVAANLVGDTVLILRCKDQTTEAAFSTKYNYLGSRSVDVTLRINDEKLTIEQNLPGNLSPADWNLMMQVLDAVKSAIPDAANRPAGEVLEHVLGALR